MYDPLVAVIVKVPGDYFPDDDDIALTAGKFVCSRLESHLVHHGHSIPEWVRGGCDEDWGVYFESQKHGERFDFAICFFGNPVGEFQDQMIVQYGPLTPFLKSLFKRPTDLGEGHHLHKTMDEFGKSFSASRMLTKSQFEAEY
jgi:hypothetical protein